MSCAAIQPPRPYLPSREGLEGGETITVKGDENIYGIARAHNVSMRDLIVLNNLKPPFTVRPGQTLTLPAGGGSSFAGDMKPPDAAPLAPVEKNELSPITPAGVSSEQLEPIAPAPATPPQGALHPPVNLAPQSLVMPPPPATQPMTMAEPVQALNRPSLPQKQVATTASPAPAPMPAPKPDIPPAAVPAATASAAIAMIWPVQGPVLSGFGPKGAGLNNDGVNIGAPKGAPVVAAAPGTVVYAGDEMKGFGNLVLIRHSGDWVTAYAHLDRVLVKKDAIVDQGDEIGTVGKTGNVPTPQLHFETRKAGKAVDPAGVVKESL